MERNNESWAGFKGELWKKEINVRDFIQNNYTPYTGDDSFLKPSSEKTRKVWNKLTEMFKVEREKGVYDTETKLPQSITTYGPGYIDKDKWLWHCRRMLRSSVVFSRRAVSVWWKTAWKLTVIISTR